MATKKKTKKTAKKTSKRTAKKAAPKAPAASATTKKNGRGSPEAVAKRRSARALNKLISGKSATGMTDGRFARTISRTLKEIDDGTKKGSKKPMKVVDLLHKVEAVLERGASPAAIRKVLHTKPLATNVNEQVQGALIEAQKAYGFQKRTFVLLGLSEELATELFGEDEEPAEEPEQEAAEAAE